jgi:uncharacterized protein (DUF2164 family)
MEDYRRMREAIIKHHLALMGNDSLEIEQAQAYLDWVKELLGVDLYNRALHDYNSDLASH